MKYFVKKQKKVINFLETCKVKFFCAECLNSESAYWHLFFLQK